MTQNKIKTDLHIFLITEPTSTKEEKGKELRRGKCKDRRVKFCNVMALRNRDMKNAKEMNMRFSTETKILVGTVFSKAMIYIKFNSAP